MSASLPPIDPKHGQSVLDRMHRAGWLRPSIRMAENDGLNLDLNFEGSKRFQEFDKGFERKDSDTVAALMSKFIADLQPPDLEPGEIDALQAMLVAYSLRPKDKDRHEQLPGFRLSESDFKIKLGDEEE